MSYDKPTKAELHMILDAWFKLRSALERVKSATESPFDRDAAVQGCHDAYSIASAALRSTPADLGDRE